MRKLFVFMLLLLAVAVSAQTDKAFMTVDWGKIKAEVEANPQHVQQLVDILINVDADTTLTAEDKILAVYGRTYLNNGRDMFMELDMSKARNEGKFDVAATHADKVLASNPLNTNAIVSKIYNFRILANKEPDKSWMLSDSLKVYTVRLSRILDTIFMTGDGSKEHPFSVTSVGDEYNLLQFFFGIFKVNGQSVVGTCDCLVLGETNKNYSSPDIYFDVKRVFEIEKSMFESQGGDGEVKK